MASQQIKIDRDIPMPSSSSSRIQYPFNAMEIGESFQYPGLHPTSAYNTASSANIRLHPKKFTCRMKDGVARIWRVA